LLDVPARLHASGNDQYDGAQLLGQPGRVNHHDSGLRPAAGVRQRVQIHRGRGRDGVGYLLDRPGVWAAGSAAVLAVSAGQVEEGAVSGPG
jgi:hypothetical protein